MLQNIDELVILLNENFIRDFWEQTGKENCQIHSFHQQIKARALEMLIEKKDILWV